MKSKQILVRKYETSFARMDVSIENINYLVRLVNIACRHKGMEYLHFCQQAAPQLFRNSYRCYRWGIEEHDLEIAALKSKIFKKSGKLRDIYLNSNLKQRDEEVIKIMFNAEKLNFLGFEIDYCIRSLKPIYHISAVYSLSGKYGSVHFCIQKTWDKKRILQVLSYEVFTPQNVVCKKCEYFYGQTDNGNYLTCAIQPKGPTHGYDGCIDKTVVNDDPLLIEIDSLSIIK
jgi:hypothetical protein